MEIILVVGAFSVPFLPESSGLSLHSSLRIFVQEFVRQILFDRIPRVFLWTNIPGALGPDENLWRIADTSKNSNKRNAKSKICSSKKAILAPLCWGKIAIFKLQKASLTRSQTRMAALTCPQVCVCVRGGGGGGIGSLPHPEWNGWRGHRHN